MVGASFTSERATTKKLRASPLSLVLLLTVLASMTACTKSWESEQIDARVVDAGSGAPVADAVVLVSWRLTGYLEGYPAGHLMVFERVTDSGGRFHTPAWGPKRPSGRVTVDGDQPVVRVFKRGYEPLEIGNFVGAPGQDLMRAERHIRPHVNGQALRLKRFEGSPEEYSQQLNSFWSPLLVDFVSARCDWQAAPLFFKELAQMKAEFLQADVRSHLMLERELCRSSGVPRG